MANKTLPARRYSLVVDSCNPDEPEPRLFGSLASAWEAYDKLDKKWLPFTDLRCATFNDRGGIYWPRINRKGKIIGSDKI